jgi:RNA polymerase sigma-70 factor, ECF subfamily
MVASSNIAERATSWSDVVDANLVDANLETHTQRAWAEHHEALKRFIARRLPRGGDADDVLQTLFLNFHRHFGSSGEPPAAPAAWLYQAARHAIVDRYRAASRRREEPVGDFDALDALEAGQPVMQPEEARPLPAARCVQPLLTRLSAADRDALVLTDLGGATQQQAAEQRGISVPGMKARVQRARRRFKAALDACCELTFDGRGQVLSAQPRAGRPSPCRTGSSSCTPTC